MQIGTSGAHPDERGLQIGSKRDVSLPTHPWIIVYLWVIINILREFYLMEIRILKPRKALNKAFLKVNPTLEIETEQLVYQLYNLTPEEIAIVENSIK